MPKPKKERNLVSIEGISFDTSNFIKDHVPGNWKRKKVDVENPETHESPLLAEQRKEMAKVKRNNKIKGVVIMLTKPLITVTLFIASCSWLLESFRSISF